MRIEDIEDLLGLEAVELIEHACTVAFKAAEKSKDQPQALEAIRELLLQMLSAAIITPPDGAVERTSDAAQKLALYVNASLAQGKGNAPKQR